MIRLTASSYDATAATEIDTAICDMKMVIMLVLPNRFGTNTKQWHSVPAESAMATLRVPISDASFGCSGSRSRSW